MALSVLLACGDDSELQRVEYLDGGSRVIGALKNGKKHGQWLSTDADGRLEKLENFRNGVLHGPAREWYPDIPEYFVDQYYRHGKNHGRWRIFYDRSQIAEIGWFFKGWYKGTWCIWEPDGRVEKITEYRRGRIVREIDHPDWPCPVTEGPGRRHLDPDNTDYK